MECGIRLDLTLMDGIGKGKRVQALPCPVLSFPGAGFVFGTHPRGCKISAKRKSSREMGWVGGKCVCM